MDRSDVPRAERRRLTHVDRGGRPRMVDVSAKPATARRAVAEAEVAVAPETMSLVIDGGGSKGDVLTVAELAGVMGGKRTSELIPLCHPVRVSAADLSLEVEHGKRPGVRIRAEVRGIDRTGFEMEALTAVTVAGLTIYDMCKSADRSMRLDAVQLDEKRGGKSGTWRRSPR